MVTVRDASARTGASVSVIRKWYRNGAVRSEMRDGPHGPERVVALGDVETRKEAWDSRPEAAPAAVPEGKMLVPVEAWEQSLLLMGGFRSSLHELASELADARADAAAAKTRAEFLTEQLREARAALVAKTDDKAAQSRRRWFGRAEPPSRDGS